MLRNPKGGAARGGPGEGEGRADERWGWESEGRAASRSSPASARPPQPGSYPSRLLQVHRSTTEKTPPPEAEMLLSPRSPFSRPIFPLAFFSGLKPQEGGGLRRGKKDGKGRGNVPLPSTPDISPNLLRDGRSPGPPLCSRAGRGHFPATARSEATEGGAGRVPAARSPAGAAGGEAAVAGRPPLPASTQATCATSCRRGVSTAPNRNRRRRCRRRRCAAPARLPLGAR